MHKKILNVKIYFWLLFIISSLFFILFPQIDLYVASLFYDGESFPLKNSWLEQLIYHSIRPIIIIFLLASITLFIYNFFTKKSILNLNAKVLLYLILVLGVAPGIIVNGILKPNWGRPRPIETTNFGGKMVFTPAFIPTKQDGYSFSSGHAAATFSLIGFVILASRKRFWMSIVLIYAAIMGVARMSAGGHFLSDVVTSFFIVYISTSIIHMIIFKEKEP